MKFVNLWKEHSLLKILAIVLIVIGIFLRFANLDLKPYWNDEVVSSLRAGGYTETELFEQVFNGQVRSIEDLQKYQRPSPEKGAVDVISSLAVEEPQSPPIYYLIAHYWMRWVSPSVTAMRGLSALLSLLALPCLFWLCLELFAPPTGWVAVALLAVSPFHVIYAQEARLYSLWTVTVLLMSAAFVRARRIGTAGSWAAYTASVIVGLYTFPFSALVAASHGIYSILLDGIRITKRTIAYLIATLIAVIAYTPWLFFITANSYKMSSFRTYRIGSIKLIFIWISDICKIFFDFNFRSEDFSLSNPLSYVYLILSGLVFSIFGYSIYFLCRRSAKQTWLFVLILIGTTSLPLLLPDLILGGQRATINRYQIPSYLGVHLAVSYLLACQISAYSAKRWRSKLWQLTLLSLTFVGICSSIIYLQSVTWWHKGWALEDIKIATIINQAKNPLVISQGERRREGKEIALSYFLEPEVPFLLIGEDADLSQIQIPTRYSDLFLYQPPSELRNELEQNRGYRLERGFRGYLWWIEQ